MKRNYFVELIPSEAEGSLAYIPRSTAARQFIALFERRWNADHTDFHD